MNHSLSRKGLNDLDPEIPGNTYSAGKNNEPPKIRPQKDSCRPEEKKKNNSEPPDKKNVLQNNPPIKKEENLKRFTPLERFFYFLSNLIENNESEDQLNHIFKQYLKDLRRSELNSENFEKDKNYLEVISLKYFLMYAKNFPDKNKRIKNLLQTIYEKASQNQKLLIAQVFDQSNPNLKFLSTEDKEKLWIEFFSNKIEETKSEYEISQKNKFNIFQGNIFNKIFCELNEICKSRSEKFFDNLENRKINKNEYNGKLSHSIVISEKGGFYAILNCLSKNEWDDLSDEMKKFLLYTQINFLLDLFSIKEEEEKRKRKGKFFGDIENKETSKEIYEIGPKGKFYQFLTEIKKDLEDQQIKLRDENDKKLIDSYLEKEKKNLRKVLIGKGGFGTVRLSMCILKPDYFSLQSSEIIVGEINCVKKFKGNKNLLKDTWSHFSSEQFGKYYLPIFDISLNGLKTVYKGYVIQKMLTFKSIDSFDKNDKKHYFFSCAKAAKNLLYKKGIAMTDFCTQNVLYDEISKGVYVIDLSQSPKVEKNEEGRYMSKSYGVYHTKEVVINEKLNKKEEIDMEKVYIFLLNKICKILFAEENIDNGKYILTEMRKKYDDRKITLKEICLELEKIFDLKREIQIENYMEKIKILILEKKDIDFLKLVGLNKEIVSLYQQLASSNENIISTEKNKKWLRKRYVNDNYETDCNNLPEQEIIESFNHFIESEDNQKKVLILLAEAGLGKSMILKLFYLSLIDKFEKNKNGKCKIPIFLDLGKSISIDDQWEQIINYLIKIDKNQIKFSLNNKFPKIYLIDAFDEARINFPFVKFFLYDKNITHSNKLILTSRYWYHFNNKNLIFVKDYYKNITTIKYLNKFEENIIKEALGEQNFKNIKRNNLLEYAKIPYLFYIISNLPEDYKEDMRLTRYDIIQKNINEKLRLNKKSENNYKSDLKIVNDFAKELYKSQKRELADNESIKFLKNYQYVESKDLKDQNIFILLNKINPDIDINHLSFDHTLSLYGVVIEIICKELQIIFELNHEKYKLQQECLMTLRAFSNNDYELIRLLAEHIQKNQDLSEKLGLILKEPKQYIDFLKSYGGNFEQKNRALISNVVTVLNASNFTFFNLDLAKISEYLNDAILRDANLFQCKIDKKRFSNQLIAYVKTQTHDKENYLDPTPPFKTGHLKTFKIDQIYLCNNRDLIIILGNSKIMYFDVNFIDQNEINGKTLPDFPKNYEIKCFDVFDIDPKNISILLGCSQSSEQKFEIQIYNGEWSQKSGKLNEIIFELKKKEGINCDSEILNITHFSEDIFVSLHPKFILVWNFSTLKFQACLGNNTGKLSSFRKICFHPNEPNIIFSGVYQLENYYIIQSWDIKSARLRNTIKIPNEIKFFDLSNEKMYFLESGKNCVNLSFFDLEKINLQQKKIAINNTKSFCISKNGKDLCLISDRAFEIRKSDDLENIYRKCEMTKENSIKHESSFFWDDQNKIIIGTNMGTIRVSESIESFLFKEYNGFSNKVSFLCFSPLCEKLILGASDHYIKFFEKENARMLRKEFFEDLFIEKVGFSENEEYIFLVGEKKAKYKSIRILSFPDFEIKYNEEFINIKYVSFLPDNILVFSVYDKQGDYKINLFNLEKKQKEEISCKIEIFYGKLFDDNLLLIHKPNDLDFVILTLRQNKLNEKIRKNKRIPFIKNLVFEIMDNDCIISGTDQGYLSIWKESENQFVFETKTEAHHHAAITSLHLCKNNDLLVSGSEDKSIKIWRLGCNYVNLYATLQGHQDIVNCVCFSNDGRYIASGSYDKNILLWKNIKKNQNRDEWALDKVISSGETLLRPEIEYDMQKNAKT